MSPKQIYYFLGKCLALGEAPQLKEEILHTIGKTSFSWEQFVQVGSNHLVLPALYVKFQEAELLPLLPPELVLHLAKIHDLNQVRNQKILKQVHWLIALLQKEEIHPLFIKGAGVLLEGLYKDPAERILTDIDCLVREADFLKAVELLKAEGYNSPVFHPASLPMMHHYPSLYKPGEAAKLEVHRYPVGRRQLKYLDLSALNRHFTQTADSLPSYTLKGQDQILLNVIHNQLKDQGQYYANIPLRNIYEFYRLSLEHELSALEIHHPYMKGVFNRYMAVAKRLFSPAFNASVQKSPGTSLFLFRFDLNKSSRFYAHFSRTSRSVADLFLSYLRIISRALVHKEVRRYLRARLSRPSWYRHHLGVIRKRFSR